MVDPDLLESRDYDECCDPWLEMVESVLAQSMFDDQEIVEMLLDVETKADDDCPHPSLTEAGSRSSLSNLHEVILKQERRVIIGSALQCLYVEDEMKEKSEDLRVIVSQQKHWMTRKEGGNCSCYLCYYSRETQPVPGDPQPRILSWSWLPGWPPGAESSS